MQNENHNKAGQNHVIVRIMKQKRQMQRIFLTKSCGTSVADPEGSEYVNKIKNIGAEGKAIF